MPSHHNCGRAGSSLPFLLLLGIFGFVGHLVGMGLLEGGQGRESLVDPSDGGVFAHVHTKSKRIVNLRHQTTVSKRDIIPYTVFATRLL